MRTTARMIKIGGFLAVALAVSPIFTGGASAYSCLSTEYSGSATNTFMYKARAAAMESWRNAMKQQFGVEWSVWSIAEDSSVECHQAGTRTTCLVRARPCKYVVQ